MNAPTKEEIKAHLTLHKRDFKRADLAIELGVSKSRLDNCLSKESMPESMRLSIAKLTGMNMTQPIDTVMPDSIVSVAVPHENWLDWEKKALEAGETVSDWIVNLGNAESAIVLKEEFGISLVPKKEAHVMAAAGSGIYAEVIDLDPESMTMNVRIYGLSMVETFNDDDVVTFRTKKASRSIFMKKGLVYLVEYQGNLMVKEYNTRKPTSDEQGAEYIQDGSVKVLRSHNPDKSLFPEIIITQEIEWLAWYDPKFKQ